MNLQNKKISEDLFSYPIFYRSISGLKMVSDCLSNKRQLGVILYIFCTYSCESELSITLHLSLVRPFGDFNFLS